jgi:hypothetical protein
LVAGKDEICGNGETRTTQKEAKLEEQESERSVARDKG